MRTCSPVTGLRATQRRDRPTNTPGAVVIGGDYQGLGIVRSLGRMGVPVCVVDDEHSIARFSRYATYSAQASNLRNPDAVVEILLELGRRFYLHGWVLFPTRDELVAALSMHRTVLSQVFRVPTPDWDAIEFIWDKRKTYRLAKELGIPIPETWFPGIDGDLDQVVGSFPVALKPAIKEHFFYATKVKAWRANSRAELVELYRRATRLAGPGEIVVQDLIPGDGSHQFAYCAFFKDGNALGSMVACRRRQHPHEFGRASTYVQTVDLPELEEPSERFLRKIKYYGLVEMEYKLDSRDGQFKLLDVNARTWGYHTLGASAGVDFPYLLYADQLGQTLGSSRGSAGKSWVRLITDFPTAIVDVSSGRLKLTDYIRSLRRADTEAVFSGQDPFPGLVECALVPYMAVRRGF
jgi:D-aspartate ligase